MVNVYQVIVGGNVVYENCNKKPCLRKCLSLSKDRSKSVELKYLHSNGVCVLVNFWN